MPYHSILNPNSEPLYRCNRCDAEGTAEELRVYLETRGRNNYRISSYKILQIPLEMLLCDQCKELYRLWNADGGVGVKKLHPNHYASFAPTLVLPTSDWFRVQWRKRALLAAPSSLSIPWRQIPPSTANYPAPATA